MKNNNRNQVTKLGLFLAAACPLLLSCFFATPAIGQKSLELSSSNISEVKTAIKESRKTGKPLLRQSTLSERISNINSSATKRDIQKASHDLKDFVNENFTLTAQQKRTLNNLSQKDIAKIKAALSKAEKENTPVKFSFATGNRRISDGVISISEVSEGLGRTAKVDGGIHIHIHINCPEKKKRQSGGGVDSIPTTGGSGLPAKDIKNTCSHNCFFTN